MTRATARRRRTASALTALALVGGIAAAELTAALVAAPAAHADSWRDKEYWLAESGITKAWEVSKGASVKVAVIDSGVDGTHPDLAGVLAGGADISGAGAANGEESIGAKPEHGTLVATMLAGRGHQPAKPSASASTGPAADSPAAAGAGPDGIVGVAPEAQLLSVSTWLGSANPGGKPTRTRFPRRSAGPSTTGPASSTSPSAAPPRNGRRAGTRRSCTPNRRMSSSSPPPATGWAATSRWARPPRFRAC